MDKALMTSRRGKTADRGVVGSCHVVIGVCTYKRPDLLRRLLIELFKLHTEGLFSFSIVVVDNDSARSAIDTVADLSASSPVRVDYCCEPRQNIALARNAVVREAKGDYVAFIDDDEYPDTKWLFRLVQTALQTKASVVLGPVIADRTRGIPPWLEGSRLLERSRFPTGTRITSSSAGGTGNVMFASEMFTADPEPFNPRFGLTGGEDGELFQRILRDGRLIVWCDDAHVYEVVSPERLRRRYYLRRALLRGVSEARLGRPSTASLLKSTAAICIYSGIVAVLFILRRDYWMKYLVKCLDHLGKLTAAFGCELVSERRFG
jgi:succinoglycan biosynthesis protein ExoM